MIETTIDALWNQLKSKPRQLIILARLADAYRDEGNDDYADCLMFCYRTKRVPKRRYNGLFDWYLERVFSGDKTGRSYMPKPFWYAIRDINEITPKVRKLDEDGAVFYEGHFIGQYYYGHKTRKEAYLFLCNLWPYVDKKELTKTWPTVVAPA